MTKPLNVGMAEFKVVHNPCLLEAQGLGACVAICLRDSKTKIAALAHVMLPEGKNIPPEINPLRFVDRAIDAMLGSMIALGCKKEDIVAKLCGGADIFPEVPKVSELGKKNIDAAKKKLGDEGIPVVAEDVGGNSGRSVCFDTENGEITVKKLRCEGCKL